MLKRRQARVIKIGQLKIGGNYPILLQSMTNVPTTNVKATIRQIKRLEEIGCEIVRVAVPNLAAAQAIGEIKRRINLPLVADIHFNHQLALEAAKQGVDKLRINPGTIGSFDKIKEIIIMAKKEKIPLRLGINAASLEKDILEKYGGRASSQAMVESALRHIKFLEDLNFGEIIISLKASDVLRTVEAYRLLADKVDYPFHLGITEAGTFFSGTVKSAIGLGALLLEGIGDTIRVSLTDHPVEEIKTAKEILQALNLRQFGRQIISCPTCGRMEINLIKLVKEVEKRTAHIQKPIKIAVMGCMVNGPGEAREADIGVAGGKERGVIFRHGKPLRVVPEEKIVDALLEEIKKII